MLYLYSKDRNHFGPTPDKLMPDSENMRTSIQIGNNFNGSRTGTDTLFKLLNQASREVEMNLR